MRTCKFSVRVKHRSYNRAAVLSVLIPLYKPESPPDY